LQGTCEVKSRCSTDITGKHSDLDFKIDLSANSNIRTIFNVHLRSVRIPLV